MEKILKVKPLFRKPQIFDTYTELVVAESTRHGGVSQAPYASLNLGGSTQDDQDHVAENNLRFFSSLGIALESVAKSHQIHGVEILNVVKPGRYEGYDALISNTKNVQLAVTIADCTPILIFDPVQHAVAAIHAGWRGTVQGIVTRTLQSMKQYFGTNPAHCLAYVGTCIDACSFEVGEEVAEHFNETHKHWNTEKGRFFIDLKNANRSQLLEAGVPASQIETSAYSTVLDNRDYFSYRFEKGVTGRLLATIGMVG
jgi:polyphenol oxidase